MVRKRSDISLSWYDHYKKVKENIPPHKRSCSRLYLHSRRFTTTFGEIILRCTVTTTPFPFSTLRKITGWLDTILDYTFKIVYRPGVLKVLPDALSRQLPKDSWTAKPKNIVNKVYAYIHLIRDKNTVRNDVPKIKRQTVLAETHAIGNVGANKRHGERDPCTGTNLNESYQRLSRLHSALPWMLTTQHRQKRISSHESYPCYYARRSYGCGPHRTIL